MKNFPKYANAPFHMAAESYGGRFLSHMASEIRHENKEFLASPDANVEKINLASVMIDNGLVDPRIQMLSVVEYGCEGPYAIHDDPFGSDCTALRSRAPVCQRLIEGCYKYESSLTCIPVSEYWNSLFGQVFSHGHDMYDARKKCNPKENGDLCYKELLWAEKWMNNPSTKIALGVDPSLEFKSCNNLLNLEFRLLHGDGSRNGAALLPELIKDGIRLLIYAGNTDLMCSYMGEAKFVSNLDNVYRHEFLAAPYMTWSTPSGHIAGEVRSAGGDGVRAGNVTLAIIYEAGHMVPYDQPEAALDMMLKWINDVSLA